MAGVSAEAVQLRCNGSITQFKNKVPLENKDYRSTINLSYSSDQDKGPEVLISTTDYAINAMVSDGGHLILRLIDLAQTHGDGSSYETGVIMTAKGGISKTDNTSLGANLSKVSATISCSQN
jgi:hypothetical protein